MRARTLMVFTVGLLVGGCGPRQATSPPGAEEVAAVRQAIEEANARYVDAMKRGDTAAVHLDYADDAIVMGQNEPARRGRTAVAQGFAEVLSRVTVPDGSVTTQDVMLAGDMAIETGAFQFAFQPKGKAPVTVVGKYLTVWKRQADGSWKIIRDASNSDHPPAP